MALNQVSFGLAHMLGEGDEIILSHHEHASVVLPWYRVAEHTGAVVRFVPLDQDGRITPEALESVVSPKTKVVCLASTTNVLGYTLDVKRMASIAHSVG